MNKKYEIRMTDEQFRRFVQLAIKALERIGKIVCGKNFSIAHTAYAKYLGNGCNISFAVLMKLVVNILMYCEQHDQYCEMYDTEHKKPKLRKHIAKGCISRIKNGTPNVIRFQFRISNTIFTGYDLLNLLNLYPQTKDHNGEDRVVTAAKMALTEIEFIANNSKLNAHDSTAGGKLNIQNDFDLSGLAKPKAMKQLEKTPMDHNVLNLADIKCTTLVEPFARTIAFTLNNLDLFDKFYCGDTDYGFVNYMEVIDKWCNELIDSIKEQFKDLADTFTHKRFRIKKGSRQIKRLFKRKKTFHQRRYYWRGKNTNDFYKKLLKRSRNVTPDSRKAIKVAAAAALYIVINVSFCGNEKNAVSTLMDTFSKKLSNHVSDLKYLSANMPKIKYVQGDFRKTLRKYINDPATLIILDPPYLKEFGLLCGDYENEFTYKDMLDMFKLLKNAKCKVILFHSRSYWFDSTAVSCGFRKVGYYVGGNTNSKHTPYFTEVYCLNIKPSVKFFDPKTHGGLY